MAYRLGRDESTSEGVVRVIDEQLDTASRELAGHTDQDRDAAVHTARKAFKKARAGMRLVRAGLDRDAYRTVNRDLRDAGRSLSATRDGAVLVETLEALVDHAGDLLSPGAYAGTREALSREHRATADQVLGEVHIGAAAADLADRARASVGGLRLDGGDELVVAGLRTSYRRARRRGREAQQSPTTERLHEWRKRVKDLWYHLRLMDEAWPEVMGPLAGQARELSELLGDDHDLAVLRGTLAPRPELFTSPAGQMTLLDVLDARRVQLQAEAFMLGRRLHAEKPKAFARRVSAYRAAARA